MGKRPPGAQAALKGAASRDPEARCEPVRKALAAKSPEARKEAAREAAKGEAPGRSAMSLKPSPIEPVPEVTARVARAAFRKGNPLLRLRDELGAIFVDADFADLFPRRGQPGLAPWRLALVTLLQFREDLSDRRAAEAVRARIDWKYLMWTAWERASHIKVEHRW